MTINVYEFAECLTFSQGTQQESDMATIQSMFLGCTQVKKTETRTDKTGIDYIATLRGTREVAIDAKRRRAGASQFWRHGPELALEIWSVMPGGELRTPDSQAKTGWTLSESVQAELILFVFDPSDTKAAYLLPFQLLRVAFRNNFHTWQRSYMVKPQFSRDRITGRRWQSKAVFVPYSVVWDGIQDASRGLRIWPAPAIDKQVEQPWLEGFEP